MITVGIRELQRNPGKLLEELVHSGEPVIITSHGRPTAVLSPIDQDELEDYILSTAPEFVKGRAAADRELKEGKTQPLSAVLAELDAEANG